jgi:predicted ribonuclease YlaK
MWYIKKILEVRKKILNDKKNINVVLVYKGTRARVKSSKAVGVGWGCG